MREILFKYFSRKQSDMKINIVFTLLFICFLFQACEMNDEPTPQNQSGITSLQKRSQDNISFYVSVTGKGEVYVEIDEKTSVVKEGETITFEVPEDTPIRLSVNEDNGSSFWGWYVSGVKVTNGLAHEINATPDLDIGAVFGNILTINISGPGSIKVTDVLENKDVIIDKTMCPYPLFLGEDKTSIPIDAIPSEDWYIYSITDNKGHSYTNYVDVSESKTVDIIFCEFTRYLLITESPGNVNFSDYDFTVAGYEYIDASFSEAYPFEINNTGGYITHRIADYVQSKGLTITFSNNIQRTLKVKITFDGEIKEYSISNTEFIKLKSYNYQEDRLLKLDIKISK